MIADIARWFAYHRTIVREIPQTPREASGRLVQKCLLCIRFDKQRLNSLPSITVDFLAPDDPPYLPQMHADLAILPTSNPCGKVNESLINMLRHTLLQVNVSVCETTRDTYVQDTGGKTSLVWAGLQRMTKMKIQPF